MLDTGSHVWQLSRQGVYKLSIEALGGSSTKVLLLCVYNDDDDNGTMTQISRFAGQFCQKDQSSIVTDKNSSTCCVLYGKTEFPIFFLNHYF